MRFFTISVSILVVFSAVPAAAMAPSAFPDVAEGHPYASAIRQAYDYGFIAGDPDGMFRPDDTINRAEFAKIIVSVATPKEDIATCMESWEGNSFSDVPADAWFAPYVARRIFM
ncbi:S-layer homology domain-containing protein [Candidatus Peregrinibacteria bacterium]|nr:S-layer homology domain-containing protein [Candidatus Peregrinibacteria bacterium]